ncbi:MAG: adenosylmethionine decarboxylase [bacterium]|nr:adenosylmethionine decarboxylase [bacterium]
MIALGRQILAEYYDCDHTILNSCSLIQKYMESAAQACNATIVKSVFHLFNPHGISGVVVIAESHLAIHTWPEYGYAAVDIFTCGDTVDPWKAFEFLKEKLKASYATTMEMKRGQLDLQHPQHLAYKPLVETLNSAATKCKVRD